MIKMITWIDDGREEVVTITSSASPVEEGAPARPFSWELLHERFAARLHDKEGEG